MLELAVLYAAPFGATLLADLGARVIKVESLDGDPIRTIVPFPEAGGAKVMQGKESVCIDLSTQEGLAIVHELARRSDLVLQGFRASAAERLGVDAATLRSTESRSRLPLRPGIRHRPTVRAPPVIRTEHQRRWRNRTRQPRTRPSPSDPASTSTKSRDGAIRLSGAGTQTNAQADGFAALGVATSLLLGLLARERGAGGQAMVASMLSTAAHAMGAHVVDYPGNVGPPTPDHELRGLGARYRVYDAADGWVFLAAPVPARVGRRSSPPSQLTSTLLETAGSPPKRTVAATTATLPMSLPPCSPRVTKTTGSETSERPTSGASRSPPRASRP